MLDGYQYYSMVFWFFFPFQSDDFDEIFSSTFCNFYSLCSLIIELYGIIWMDFIGYVD